MNRPLRVFGLYGEAGELEAFSRELPPVQADLGAGDTTNGFLMRVDTHFAEDEDDPLFATPDGFEDQTFAEPHWPRGP
jgi:hypothetical protein